MYNPQNIDSILALANGRKTKTRKQWRALVHEAIKLVRIEREMRCALVEQSRTTAANLQKAVDLSSASLTKLNTIRAKLGQLMEESNQLEVMKGVSIESFFMQHGSKIR